ncbi:MAG TPA: hypothetical protein VHZ24_08410 [Pirellulales bacterium]|jgi:antitoxin component YwqK of YwqJK toxin-antitoxin module|nr:hypothetical protein [Pirellulales bacterium]
MNASRCHYWTWCRLAALPLGTWLGAAGSVQADGLRGDAASAGAPRSTVTIKLRAPMISAPAAAAPTEPAAFTSPSDEAPPVAKLAPPRDDATLQASPLDPAPSRPVPVRPQQVPTRSAKFRAPSTQPTAPSVAAPSAAAFSAPTVYVPAPLTTNGPSDFAAENHGEEPAWTHWEDGRPAWRGIEHRGLRQGRWVRWFYDDAGAMFDDERYAGFERPFMSIATFDDGVLEGTLTIVDNQGHKLCELQVVDGVLEGRSVWYFPNGQPLREAHYKAGMLEGSVRQWSDDRALVEDEHYRRGRKLRPHLEQNADGHTIVEGEFYTAGQVKHATVDWFAGGWNETTVTTLGADQRTGKWIWSFPNGQKQLEGEYEDDVASGRFIWYYTNAQPHRQGTFSHGQPDGVWASWHPNGQKESEGAFSRGQPVGMWMAWDIQGKLQPFDPKLIPVP